VFASYLAKPKLAEHGNSMGTMQMGIPNVVGSKAANCEHRQTRSLR
tara:strand:+ start:9170 stop:9307 length:138 start_codon:yes stop_codon:yes gene_type:complete